LSVSEGGRKCGTLIGSFGKPISKGFMRQSKRLGIILALIIWKAAMKKTIA
jgi:hypothetical protein